jgi:hypothetical protein
MKRTLTYARKIGSVPFEAAPGQVVQVPLFPGILKHLAPSELRGALSSPATVRKYTCEALRTAAWPILREFPRDWIKTCLPLADLRPGRRRALEFLLG